MILRFFIFSLVSVIVIHAEQSYDKEVVPQGFIHSKSDQRYDAPVNQEVQEEMIKTFGKLRTAYIYRDDHTMGHNTNYATALGGQFGFDTASYEGFNLHLGAYTSVKIKPLTGEGSHENQEFFDADANSYIYLGEANLAYKHEDFEAMFGRILIDTPYADSDDARMSPNTFEGAWAYQKISQEVSAQVYYFSRMAGSGSNGSQDEFDDLFDPDGFGLAGGSLDYHFDGDNAVSLWYYYVDKMSHILYSELNYSFILSPEYSLDTAFQVSSIQEMDSSGIQGDVLGASALMHYKKLFFGGAYNYGFVASNEQITDGFGGGAYYTSLDEATIGAVSSVAVGEDVQAYRLGVGYEAVLVDDFVIELIHGHLQSQAKTVDIQENDIVLSYQLNEAFYFELIGAKYEDEKSGNEFERLVARVDYSF